jgi:hypothetical protein
MQQCGSLDALQQEQVTHWLSAWHAWSSSSDRAANGYAGVSAGFGMHRTSRQYDDANGAMDLAADIAEARAVDGVIQRMADPWRTALHVEARNTHAPARVWMSIRLMHEDVKKVTQEARSMLWRDMERANLAPS